MLARAAPAVAFDRSPDARPFRIVGRLKAGVSLADARRDAQRALSEISPRADSRPEGNALVEPLSDTLFGAARPVLLAFAVAAVLVLLVACANIASILIGRTIARQRELAVCRALGAGPGRLFVQILSESLLIATMGTAIGTLLAIWAVRMIQNGPRGSFHGSPRSGSIGWSSRSPAQWPRRPPCLPPRLRPSERGRALHPPFGSAAVPRAAQTGALAVRLWSRKLPSPLGC